MRIMIILALALALLATIFAAQNNQTVEISFLFFELRGSLALVLLITLIIGIVIGWLLMAPSAFRRQLKSMELQRDLRRMEGELQIGEQPPESEPEE